MMRNERERQYQEDVKMLVVAAVDCRKTTDGVIQNKQAGIPNSATEIGDAVTSEDCSLREGAELEYEDNNDHNALRFVLLNY